MAWWWTGTSHYPNHWGNFYRHACASLGLNELIYSGVLCIMKCIIGRIELKKPMTIFEAKCRFKTAVSHCWSCASLIHGALWNCSLRLEMMVFWARPPHLQNTKLILHYNDVIMCLMASQIIGVFIVCSAACFGPDQRKHQSSASLAFVRGMTSSCC